jgi:hypothetical protein
MHVACAARGNTAIYKQAKDYLTMFEHTSWPGNTWDVIWYPLTASYRLESNPDLYYQSQQRYRCAYDMYRQPSGAFIYPTRTDKGLNELDAGAAVALAFTAPLKTLCITGAPRSKYARDFTMPEHLWGNDADLAFFSPKHNKDFYTYGQDEEIFVPYSQLQFWSRTGQEDLTKIDLNVMLKNVRHARYEIRVRAAVALCVNKRLGELEELLRDPDPRLRRAALDGINDYRPWFEGSPEPVRSRQETSRLQ